MVEQQISGGGKVGGKPDFVCGPHRSLPGQLVVIFVMRASYQFSRETASAFRRAAQRSNYDAVEAVVVRRDMASGERRLAKHVVIQEQHQFTTRCLNAGVARSR